MATAPSPNDLTRQQLDELDALLQKMLTVPLAPVDPSPPPAALAPLAQPPLPPSWRVDPPAAAPSLAHIATAEPPATLKFEQAPAPAPAPVPAPVAVTKAPKPAPAPVPAPTLPPAQATAPAPALKQAPPAAPAPPKAPPAPVTKPAAKPAAPVPTPPAADSLPVPLPAIPFVALNGLFDSVCGVFGPPGRLLCSGFFKNLYGLAGLGLIVYTALHVAQVQGWLTLPVQLPWPK